MKNNQSKPIRYPTNQINGWYVARLLGELGFIIALPLVLLVVAGHWLDSKFGTRVAFLILGMITALSISTYSIYKKIQKINK